MNELADAALAPAPDQALEQTAPVAEPVALPSPLDAVAAGKVPAVTMSAFNEKDPVHEFVVANFAGLPALGLDLIELEGSDNLSAIFNPTLVTAEQIEAAYKDGTLDKLAPSADALAASAEPAAEEVPAEVAPAAALAGEVAPAPAVPQGLEDARIRNMQTVTAPKVNTPTGGPLTALGRRAF